MTDNKSFYDVIGESEGLKHCLRKFLIVIADLYNEKYKDPITVATAEVFYAGRPCYNHRNIDAVNIIRRLVRDLEQVTEKDKEHLRSTARDIWNYNSEDIFTAVFSDNNNPNDIAKDASEKVDSVIETYIQFRKDIDTVPPDVAKEIDDMMKMSDEEFKENMRKQEEEDNREIDRKYEERITDYEIPDETLYGSQD